MVEAYEGTILNDTITVTTVDSNSDSINDKYLSGYGSAGSDTFIGSNNIPTDRDAHGDDNVSYYRLYYLPELTLAKSGSNVTVTKPGGAVDTLTKIDWIITKGDSGSIKTLLTPFTDTGNNTYWGSVFDDTSSVSSSSIDYAVLGPGNDTYTYSANSEEHIVTPGTGDDTINFTGNGGHSVSFEGSFERYDVSFWDGSSVSSGKKVLDKTYAPGDKVVVTDNLALSSGGTGQDVITGATDLYFSNGRQNLKMVIQMPDGEGVLTLYLMPMMAIVMKWEWRCL